MLVLVAAAVASRSAEAGQQRGRRGGKPSSFTGAGFQKHLHWRGNQKRTLLDTLGLELESKYWIGRQSTWLIQRTTPKVVFDILQS